LSNDAHFCILVTSPLAFWMQELYLETPAAEPDPVLGAVAVPLPLLVDPLPSDPPRAPVSAWPIDCSFAVNSL
jgi:hypothetical protein